MKKLGILAGIFAGLFLLFVISGSILTCAGSAALFDSVKDGMENFTGEFDDFDLDGIIDSFSDYDEGDYAHSENSYSAEVGEGVKEIILKDIAAKLYISQGTSDELVVKTKFSFPDDQNNPYVDFILEDECVTVKLVTEPGTVFGVKRLTLEMWVELPENYTGSLTLNDTAADAEISELELDTVTFKDTAGDVDAVGVKAAGLVIDDCAGDIDFSGEFSGFSVTDIAGDVKIESFGELTEDSVIENTMGRVTVSVCGEVRVEKSDNFGRVSVSGETASGRSAVLLTVRNNMGEISIDIN